jgi:WD40 repeat protein
LWDKASGSTVTARTDGRVSSIAFNRDGSLIVYGTEMGGVQIIDSATGAPKSGAVIADTGDPSNLKNVASVAFSGDDRYIASASKLDDSVRMWEISSLQQSPTHEVTMTGHERDVVAVTFSPDGRYLISGAYDDTVRVWNTQTGQPVGQPLFDFHGDVTSVMISEDNQRIISSGREGLVDVRPGPNAWKSALCSKLTNNMNVDQWDAWVKLPSTEYRAVCPGLEPAPASSGR